jgi:mono/diheme cytochrome c family protein
MDFPSVGPRYFASWSGWWLLVLAALAPLNEAAAAGDPERGYRLLINNPYLPPDFDQETFEATWQVWPEPLRREAEKSSPDRRREMAYRRYGLSPRPNDSQGRPLQYVVTEDGKWSMNCFACHGGQVNGKTLPGAPNRDYALETLTAEIRRTKLRLGKPLSHMDLGSLIMPLGTSRGTTNAVMFGVALLAYRDDRLNLLPTRLPPPMLHHDMDAPAWWHFHKKRQLYIDGFAPKAHRPLMQFMLVEQNGPEQFRKWEDDYRHVYAYLSSLRAPKSPLPVDAAQAFEGAVVFAQHCAECHGTYGDEHGAGDDYPERLVPWDQVRTDPVRLRALTPAHRRRYAESWFAERLRAQVQADPAGYVAPPLNGLWASAPYLHNGSVPTLWHLLRPDERPTVWRRTSRDLDSQRVGLDVETWDELPAEARSWTERREYFDTRQHGKSAAGHDFPARLSEPQRTALLEYLKTL